MRVKINRDVCSKPLAFCERCFGQFLKYPLGYERACFEEFEDDGKDLLTIEMQSDGHQVVLELDEAQRELLANDGWANYVEFGVPMYRNEVKT